MSIWKLEQINSEVLILMALKQESQGLFENAGFQVHYTGVGKINATIKATELALQKKPKYTRSLVTTTRTSVSNGVGSPGFGACCVSFNTGAERQMGSSNRPSSVMEPEERTAAAMRGSSLALAPALRAEASSKRKRQKKKVHQPKIGKHSCPFFVSFAAMYLYSESLTAYKRLITREVTMMRISTAVVVATLFRVPP